MLRWLDMLGLDPAEVADRLVLTPSCGLAGASPRWARTRARPAAAGPLRNLRVSIRTAVGYRPVMSDLTGKTVAIIASDFFEEPELVQPRDELRDAGATVQDLLAVAATRSRRSQGDTEPDPEGRRRRHRSTTSTCRRSTRSSSRAAP